MVPQKLGFSLSPTGGDFDGKPIRLEELTAEGLEGHQGPGISQLKPLIRVWCVNHLDPLSDHL